MKGYEVGGVGKSGQQRRRVAVAHENLRVRSDLLDVNRLRIKGLRVKGRQQVVRPISSSRANNRADIVAREHLFEFPRPAIGRTGEIQIAFEDRLEIKRVIAGAAKTVAAGLQHFWIHVRRGRDNSHLVARTKGARLDSRIVGGGNHINICHPERSEGSAYCGKLQIPRFARDDNSGKVKLTHHSESVFTADPYARS